MREKLRKIPGYSRYLIDDSGNGIIKETGEPISWHRSNGYVFATLVNDDGVRSSVGQHRAVALAYIEMPNVAESLTVNHIDGVRDNNHYSNLEWATYSDNIVHAYKTGLRKDRVPTIATEIETGKKHYFYSKNECARFLGIVQSEMFKISSLNKKKCRFRNYMLEFLIEESELTVMNPYPLGVAARRIRDGHIFVAENMTNLSRMIEVCPKVIRRILISSRFQYPVNGFDIRAIGSFDKWPSYTPDEVKAYDGIKFIYQPVLVIDQNGVETLTGSVSKASALTGLTERLIRYRLKDGGRCPKGFKYKRFSREITINA